MLCSASNNCFQTLMLFLHCELKIILEQDYYLGFLLTALCIPLLKFYHKYHELHLRDASTFCYFIYFCIRMHFFFNLWNSGVVIKPLVISILFSTGSWISNFRYFNFDFCRFHTNYSNQISNIRYW